MPNPNPLHRLLREPLLHFVVLGALLFGVDHVISGRQNDPHLIVVDPEVDTEAKTLFRDSRGEDPDDDELKTLRERWVDNEVLYREGLALGVDRGDSTIRERVIFKALNVVQANLAPPPIDAAGLRAWFDAHRARYGEPARLDFLEAVLSGDASDDAIKSLVTALNTSASGVANGGLRVYKGRPRDTVVGSFGAPFAAALETSPVGTWQALPSKEGLRVVRLDAVHPAEVVDFDRVRGEVLQDWKDEQLQELRTQAVRAVGKKYTVRYPDAAK